MRNGGKIIGNCWTKKRNLNFSLIPLAHSPKNHYLSRMKTDIKITIPTGSIEQAEVIALLIMKAMNYECCRYFAGERHNLEDFHEMMTQLVMRKDTQYSYLNTIVAMDGKRTVGALVSYDGSQLHRLRKPFIDMEAKMLNGDFSNMDDETTEGELYLDSLAVDDDYQHQGIATALIKAGIAKAHLMNIKP